MWTHLTGPSAGRSRVSILKKGLLRYSVWRNSTTLLLWGPVCHQDNQQECCTLLGDDESSALPFGSVSLLSSITCRGVKAFSTGLFGLDQTSTFRRPAWLALLLRIALRIALEPSCSPKRRIMSTRLPHAHLSVQKLHSEITGSLTDAFFPKLLGPLSQARMSIYLPPVPYRTQARNEVFRVKQVAPSDLELIQSSQIKSTAKQKATATKQKQTQNQRPSKAKQRRQRVV